MKAIRGIFIIVSTCALAVGPLGCGRGSGGGGSGELKVVPGMPVPALMEALESGKVETRVAAAKELGNIPPPDYMRAIPLVKQAIKNESDETVKSALKETLSMMMKGARGGRGGRR